MDINSYQRKIQEVGFEEMPLILFPDEPKLEDFLSYEDLDLDLKIHLTEMLIVRCFPPTGGIYMSIHAEWLIKGFLSEYEWDLIQSWRTAPIKESIDLILSNESFTKVPIGTVFMYSVIEFYAKSKIGWNPMEYDFFHEKNKKVRNEINLNHALNKLRKLNIPIAKSLNKIDKINLKKYKEVGIKDDRFTKIKVIDRLNFYRNIMLHGEKHFSSEGEYLIMLYMLFHWNEIKERKAKIMN